jgi:hypothetical protein
MSSSSPSGILVPILALCFACILGCSKTEVNVEITSIPSGAVIWLNHAPTTFRTPSDLRIQEDALVAVRLEGFKAAPLAIQVQLSDPPGALHFDLVKRTLPVHAIEVEDQVEADSPPPLAVSKLPVETTITPKPKQTQPRTVETAAAKAVPIQGHSLTLTPWDPLFTLKIDGELRPYSAGDLPLTEGPHHIQVKLNTFELLDSLLLEPGEHLLTLPSRDSFVDVQLEPSDAQLVSGSVSLGHGRCLIPRFLLPMELSFEALPGYLEPAPIRLEPKSQNTIFRYTKALSYSWAEGSIRLEGRGYRFPDQEFVSDASVAPEPMNGSLLFAKAFKSRRPSGVHAAQFVFDLPEDTHDAWPATLEILVGDSQKRVFGSFRNRATLTLLINGTSLVRDVVIENEEEQKTWPISKLIKPGKNTLEIRSTERALSRLRLDAISLRLAHD